MINEFKCPKKQAEGLVLASGSKFISYIARIENIEEAKEFILSLKKKHPFASHVCYGFSFVENLGKNVRMKCSDDKEPAGTAGKPILECIKNNNLNNTIICVVRYFGGTLLGASNLLRAYVNASQKAIDEAQLEEKKLCEKMIIGIGYNELGKVESYLNQNSCKVLDTEFAEDIFVTVAVPSSFDNFEAEIQNLVGHAIEIEKLGVEFI